MMRIVVLLGTQHPLQEAAPNVLPENIRKFQDYIRLLCSSYRVMAVAEEMSVQRMRDWKARPDRDSVPCVVAKEFGLEHQYSDPDELDRETLGIKSIMMDARMRKFFNMPYISSEVLLKQQQVEYGKREDEWLRRIVELDKWPLLFVCGLDHVGTFTARMLALDIEVIVSPPFLLDQP